MCTKLPNWGEEYNLNIGDEGFVTMQTFIAPTIIVHPIRTRQFVLRMSILKNF